jgi:hypothetical protein
MRNTDAARELSMIRWGMPAAAAHGRATGHQ